MRLALLICVLSLTACNQEQDRAETRYEKEQRRILFNECMVLSADITAPHSDIEDIIPECTDYAIWGSKGLYKEHRNGK